MSLFGTSGVRGIYGEKINAALAVRLGAALGSRYQKIAVGHDHRLSSPLLARAFCAGAASTGAQVTFGGFVPTPVLAWATREQDAGCMVTASHNPPNYNGFKFWNPDGSGFSKLQEGELEKALEKRGGKIGEIVESGTFVDDYINAVKKRIPKLDMKVVVDCNHGAACAVAPKLFKALGCEVIKLNSTPDGTYQPPKADRIPALGDWTKIGDLKKTGKEVVDSKSEAGFLFDGDADRVFLFDKNGKPVSGDDLMAALSSYVRGEVVSIVDASSSVASAAPSIHLVPVGDVYVSNALRDRKASFGGEAAAGTFFWPDLHLAPDGIYSAAKIAEKIQNQDFYFKLRTVDRFPIARGRVSCKGRYAAMKKILARVNELKPLSLLTLDGIRAELSYGWFLIRPSGTEPIIRITAQGKTADKTGEALRMAVRIVREETGK